MHLNITYRSIHLRAVGLPAICRRIFFIWVTVFLVSVQSHAVDSVDGVVGFTLVDAITDTDIVDLVNSEVYPYENRHMAIRANTIGNNVDRVRIEVNGPINKTVEERVEPYASFGDRSSNYNGLKFPVGDYTVVASAKINGVWTNEVSFGFIINNVNSEPEPTPEPTSNPTPTPEVDGVVGFTLVDAITDTDMFDLVNNEAYPYENKHMAIRANTNGYDVDKVRIDVSGPINKTVEERVEPFASFGDRNLDYNGLNFPAGEYTVVASAKINGVWTNEVSVGFIIDSNSEPEPTPEPTPNPGNNPPNLNYISGDLISLHYDFAPDPDDVLSAVFDRAVTENHGIPLENLIMVKGTVGLNRHMFRQGQFDAMDLIWPNITTLDAFNNFDNAVNTSRDRWVEVLNNGYDVWVKEGGQSDFTAEVVRAVFTVYRDANVCSNNCKDVIGNYIHVIQHSTGTTGAGFNEVYTTPEDLQYLLDNVDYRRIPNGNFPHNGSADLKENPYANWWNRARASNYSQLISVADDFLGDNADGSDTVELLHILNIGTDVVINLDDMLNVYLNGGIIPDVTSDTEITQLFFVNADNNSDAGELIDGNNYGLAGQNISIRANVTNAVQVQFALSGPLDYLKTEKVAPYALFGDREGDYIGRELPPGLYTITIKALVTDAVVDTKTFSFSIM